MTLLIDWSTEEAERRVARGAELLDRVAPDWFKRFDPSTFDLDDCAHCAVGQALELDRSSRPTADYLDFLRYAGVAPQAQYGFSVNYGAAISKEEMEAAWLRAVTSRLMGSGI